MKSEGAELFKFSEVYKMDFVITMLPNKTSIYHIFNEIIKNEINKNTIFIDSSTVDPVTAKSIEKIILSRGAIFIDAPVSGGVPGAEQATLTFMVGGGTVEYNTVKPILQVMGKEIFHCGDCGMGQAAKLCNNMLLAISIIGVSETMNLAIRFGLNPNTFANILNSSTGKCWSSEIYNPVPGISKLAPSNNNYNGGCSIDVFLKDLELISNVADSTGTPIIMGELAFQIYKLLKIKGFGNKDFSVVYDFLRN